MAVKHIVYSEPDSPKAYSGLVLLNKFYTLIENREWSKFRKRIVKAELEKNGKLVCRYCDRDDLTVDGPHNIATLDHIIPRSKGGKDVDNNVVICCSGCNQKKASSSVEEFEQSRYLKLKRKHYVEDTCNT